MANFCNKCGKKYIDTDRRGIHFECGDCKTYYGLNPRSVVAVLQPVRRSDGSISLLTGLRSKPSDSGYGKFGFPAGWHDNGEAPRQAACREAEEEQSVIIDHRSLVLFDMIPGGKLDTLVTSWLAPVIEESLLPPFVPSEEVKERKLVIADHANDLAFPVHSHWAKQYFEGKREVDPKQAGFTLDELLTSGA